MPKSQFSPRLGALLLGVCTACATSLSATELHQQPPAGSPHEPKALPPSAAPPSYRAANTVAVAELSSGAVESWSPLTAAEASAPASIEAGADDAAVAPTSVDAFDDVVSEQGQRAHGLYFNAPVARRLGASGIIRILRGSGLDAAVIDVKDSEGRVSFDSRIAELAPAERLYFPDLPAFVRELRAAGIYTIARVVCFSDPVLPKLYPDRAVHDTRPGHVGAVWNAHKRWSTWLDPYDTRNHDLIVELSKEVEEVGFDELQLDYIRFPVDEGTRFATFPAQGEIPRSQVLLGLLRRVDAALRIPLGVDVFGLAAFREGDPTGLGQSLEEWAQHVDVFSPMLYLNGMHGWLSHKTEARAGLLVQAGVRVLRERIGPVPVIRPFLQAFENGADYYNAELIAEQIRGARTGGGDGFLFWHPGSSYSLVRAGMAGARGEVPFQIDERSEARKQRPLDEQPALAQEQHDRPAAVSGDGERRAPQGS